MIIVKPEKLQGLVPRILELTSRNTPWHRQNWRAGTVEIIEEALSEMRIPGTRERALTELRKHMEIAVARDHGMIAGQKRITDHICKVSPGDGSDSYNVQLSKRLIQDIKDTYLLNWADMLDDPSKAGLLDVEGTAKRIISHLLYSGISRESIYSAIRERVATREEYSLAKVLRELDKRAKTPKRSFTFAIPVDRTPEFLHSPSQKEGWLNSKELKHWKHLHAPRAEMIRHQGGFILEVQARDVNEAADVARKLLPQLSFKFQSGSVNGFTILPIMWSQEKGSDFPTQNVSAPLKIHAFKRAGVLHELGMNPQTRNILAIIESLQTNDSHVAVVNGWVVLESLLVDPDENDWQAAERMARIVAASYFRTELTWLARNYAKAYAANCPLADEISSSETSIARAKLMTETILGERNFSLMDAVDQLAIEKMRQALEQPAETFERTFKILTREFQRLYRKRNLIVHGGQAVDYGIESTARKVVPLLINGIDQLLIANIQHNLDPRELAASIEFKAEHLGKNSHSNTYSLLELLEGPF